MKEAGEYLAYVKALIIANPEVKDWKVLREEAQGELGLFRYRITFYNDSLLEMFERFQIVNGESQITKYRYHWQDAAGQLLYRTRSQIALFQTVERAICDRGYYKTMGQCRSSSRSLDLSASCPRRQ